MMVMSLHLAVYDYQTIILRRLKTMFVFQGLTSHLAYLKSSFVSVLSASEDRFTGLLDIIALCNCL